MNDALVRPRRPRSAIGLVTVPVPARVVPMPARVPAWMSVVVLALTGAVAQAQPAPKPAPKPSAPLTIKQEVRACLDERETLRRERLALSQGFDRHEAAFRRAQDDLQAQTALKATLDLTQSAAVEAYNARVGEINGRIVALNAQAAELAESQRTLNTRVDDLNRRCAGVVISWRDHEAVLRERKASAP